MKRMLYASDLSKQTGRLGKVRSGVGRKAVLKPAARNGRQTKAKPATHFNDQDDAFLTDVASLQEALQETRAELELARKQLLETSRFAGMAEVATDVLHNVGNALNSVNVSCSLASDRVRDCSYSKLAKVAQLLNQNADQLSEFLTTNPQGKHIGEYLMALSQSFEEEKAFLSAELSQLRKHVDHVNRIVAMQQNYAKLAGVQETVDVARLVEDALQINAAALERHAVELHRQIEHVPPILVDKHKVLQILVNLIQNAKYAVSEAKRRDKELTLRVACAGEDYVQIQVNDNGVGIPPENLARIFERGFTTRRNGHGFGLHSSAQAARDLNGTLAVHSEGTGRGAVFTLKLPLKPPASTS